MATSKLGANSSTSYSPIAEKPHQPVTFDSPKTEYRKHVVVKRNFQAAWFARWTWLHYQESNDCVFCHTCVKAFKEMKMIILPATIADIGETLSTAHAREKLENRHCLLKSLSTLRFWRGSQVRNDMLKVMSLKVHVLRVVAACLQTYSYYTIMAESCPSFVKVQFNLSIFNNSPNNLIVNNL